MQQFDRYPTKLFTRVLHELEKKEKESTLTYSLMKKEERGNNYYDIAVALYFRGDMYKILLDIYESFPAVFEEIRSMTKNEIESDNFEVMCRNIACQMWDILRHDAPGYKYRLKAYHEKQEYIRGQAPNYYGSA